MAELQIVGKRIPHVDGKDKVTGRLQYCADIKLPRMLYGSILRSPHPHARILNIDTGRAGKLPGVRAVITARDCPGILYGTIVCDQPVMAKEKVRHVGEPVAAVAAESLECAMEALDLIDVQYELLPALFDPEISMRPDPPVLIHEEKYKTAPMVPPKMDVERPHVFSYFKVRRGDVDKGFNEADVVVENQFTTSMIYHCTIETHSAIACVDLDGRITVWVPTQAPYSTQFLLCNIFGILPSRMRIIGTPVGGGFGAKTELKLEHISVVLAKKTGRPVKMTLTRKEMFTVSPVRHPMVISVKDGVKKDGRIAARQIEVLLNSGAYSSYSPIVVRNAAFGSVGSYKLPNLKLDSYGIYTNYPVAGPFRGFGSPQVQWVIESQMDILAEKIGMDPIEIRLKNLLEEGDENGLGEKTHSTGADKCIGDVAKFLDWKELKREEGTLKKGKGIGVGTKYSIAPSASSCFVRVNEDETVDIITGAVDIGQGLNTILSQMAAEELGMSLEKIRIISGDTSITPYEFGSVSSRQTFNSGNAVRLACLDAKRQIFEIAARKLEARPDDLEMREGRIYVRGVPEKATRIKDLFIPSLLGGTFPEEGGIMGKTTFFYKADFLDPETGQLQPGPTGRVAAFYIHIAQGAEVEIDAETGEVKVKKFASSADVGKAINPTNVEGQMDGGVGMGLGSALMEEIRLDEGRVINPSLRDYHVPTVEDLPPTEMMCSMIVEVPHRDGPYGAKGVGEATMAVTDAAISNAIYNATGVRLFQLPMTPERVFVAIKGKR